MSVGEFGEFSLLLVIATLAYELGDLGINSAILKFGHNSGFSKILTLGLVQRSILSIFLILSAYLLQPFVSHELVTAALLGSALSFSSLIYQSFLAKEQYLGASIYGAGSNILRLIFLICLIFTGIVTPNNVILICFLSYTLVFLAALPIMKRNYQFAVSNIEDLKKTVPEVFSFSSWIAGSQAVSALTAKIGTPMLFALAGPVQTGIYASSQTIAGAISQFTGILDSVYAPKFSKGAKNEFKSYLYLALAASCLILLSIPFARVFVSLVFPPDYQSAIPVLEVMLLGYAIFFLASPFGTSVLYTFGKSKIHLSGSIIQLVATVGLYLLLLPVYGAIGAAWAFVIVNFLSLTLFAVSYFLLRKASL